MKIIMVNTRHFLGGGDATYTFNLTDLLARHGHSVAHFAMQDERNVPDPNADLFVSHVDFRALNRRKNLLAGLGAATRAIYSSEARGKFRRLIERVQPDLVHVQSLHGHLTPSVILEAQAQGLPVLWTIHDYKLICPNSTFLIDRTGQICEACGVRAYYQPVLKRCKKGSLLASSLAGLEAYAHLALGVRDRVQAFLAPSRVLRDKLLSRGFHAERVQWLPNFIPDEKLVWNAQPAGNYLLFFGRLEAYKGLDTLLAACRRVPHVRLVMAGAADAAAQGAWLDQLPGNAEYVGLKTGDDLTQLLSGALAVVVPSIWYENQPFSILEAFARRKPVIASNLGGLPELVADHERGLLVPAGDVPALAEAMSWVADHPAETQDMGEAAYQYLCREHSADKHYERLLELYTKALAGQLHPIRD